ncbi:hypothetical protein evm_002305 [Chilo suppressalis]|nr:hypothetical protein evm_002305 [Chilo suppressalis]
MEALNEISDEEFIPFLQSLGVETYKKSFEWMLNEKDFADILRWLYHNLDHNNALSAREECRYAEIEKQGQLMSSEDLEKYLMNLQIEYDGLCLPGDKDALEYVKFDINMLKERLHMLEKQEEALEDLLKQNDLVKEELNQEVTKLHSAEQQCAEDESTVAEECISLANEVDNITEEVIAVVADTLDLYRNTAGNKDVSKKFFTFGPFESYRQTQALFRSHFDLYTSKKFSGRQNNNVTDEVLRATLVGAKSMEDRLSDAMLMYIEAKAELSGQQAKLALVSNYSNVHPSQIVSLSMEAQSAIELLEQEECILLQQIQDSVKDLVDYRTRLAVETTARTALAVREQLLTDISNLQEATQRALALDRALYFALRHELRTLHEVIQFASHLRQYVTAHNDAVVSRIESMNMIALEQAASEEKLRTCDPLITALCDMLSLPPDSDAVALVKAYSELHNTIKELGGDIEDMFKKKEAVLEEIRVASLPLKQSVYEGCTKQPRVYDAGAASLQHRLQQELQKTDSKVLAVSSLYTQVKNDDKHHLRKLWQWFITDPSKLAAAVKGVQGKSYL